MNRQVLLVVSACDDPIAGEDLVRIPEGIYIAHCIGVERNDRKWNTNKLYLRFQILDGPHTGTELFMAINMEYKHFKKTTKYWRNWVIANNGKPPARNDRMPPSVFHHRGFHVKVRSTKRKFGDGTPMPDSMNYSVVDEIIKAGV